MFGLLKCLEDIQYCVGRVFVLALGENQVSYERVQLSLVILQVDLRGFTALAKLAFAYVKWPVLFTLFHCLCWPVDIAHPLIGDSSGCRLLKDEELFEAHTVPILGLLFQKLLNLAIQVCYFTLQREDLLHYVGRLVSVGLVLFELSSSEGEGRINAFEGWRYELGFGRPLALCWLFRNLGLGLCFGLLVSFFLQFYGHSLFSGVSNL